jgi:hypothetical protein
MGNEYDPRRLAEAAMKQALASEGFERQRLIRFAQAWHEIARERERPVEASATRPSHAR